MDLDYSYIGRQIRRQRLAAGLTQAMLADFADSSPQYISHIETGRKKPSLEIIVRIANVLGVSTDCLLGTTIKNNQQDCEFKQRGILSGCTRDEQQIIIEVVTTLKACLVENRKYYSEE